MTSRKSMHNYFLQMSVSVRMTELMRVTEWVTMSEWIFYTVNGWTYESVLMNEGMSDSERG